MLTFKEIQSLNDLYLVLKVEININICLKIVKNNFNITIFCSLSYLADIKL